MRVQQPQRQAVHAVMEVKGNEQHVAAHPLRQLHHHHCVAAPAHHPHIALMFDTELLRRIRIHFHIRRRTELVAVADLAGASAGVKMLDHAPGIKPERIFAVRAFVVVNEAYRQQLGAAVIRLELAFSIEPTIANIVLALLHVETQYGADTGFILFRLRFAVGPLNTTRGLNAVVAHAGDIQGATGAPGEMLHFLEGAFGRFGKANFVAIFKTFGHLVEYPEVRLGIRIRTQHVARQVHPALGIGVAAFFLSPYGGG